MSQLKAEVIAWSAWTPGVRSRTEWMAWSRGEHTPTEESIAPVTFVEPMLRRRLSHLSRMSLSVAHDCLQGKKASASIWANRHGELQTTSHLLTQLANAEPVSPMGFSLSVHNSAAGLFSLAVHETAPSVSIAAGASTLIAGMVESCAQLFNGRSDVLLVYAEEPLPAAYQEFDEVNVVPVALALHLAATGNGPSLRYEGSCNAPSSAWSLLRSLLGKPESGWQLCD